MAYYNFQHLRNPLEVKAYSLEGQSLGHFYSREAANDAIVLEGKVADLADSLSMIGTQICLIEIILPHRRPIRASARIEMQGLFRNGGDSRIVVRFTRMGSDYKRRYSELLYGGMAASL